eukprot:gene25670-21691_t
MCQAPAAEGKPGGSEVLMGKSWAEARMQGMAEEVWEGISGSGVIGALPPLGDAAGCRRRQREPGCR